MKRFPVPADMQPLSRKIPSKLRKKFKAMGLKPRLVFEPQKPEALAPELTIDMMPATEPFKVVNDDAPRALMLSGEFQDPK